MTSVSTTEEEIIIRQNPVTDLLTIETSFSITHLKVINNNEGKLVRSFSNIKGEGDRVELNLADLASGIYQVKIQSGQEIAYGTYY